MYDNCDEVRRKIAVATQSNLMSISGVCAAIGCNSNAVNRFLSKKGPDQGAGTDVYPCAYRFFECLRVAKGLPKSAQRLGNEKKEPGGFPLENPRKHVWVFTGGK